MPAKRRTTKARTTRAPRTPPATARLPKPQPVTPYLVVHDAAEAIEWYKQAFGAKEFSRIPSPDGKIMHAGITISGGQVFLSDVFPGSDLQAPTTIGGTAVNLHLWSKDCDKLWERAVAAGAKVAMPLEDQFWGDRYGKLTDPFGHSWALSRKAKLTKEEMARKQAEAMRRFGTGAP